MNINLELYRIFYVVAKNKHMTRASEELHISQPAISQSIKKFVNVVYCFQINAVFSLQIRKLSVSLQHETSVTTSKVTDDWRMKM